MARKKTEGSRRARLAESLGPEMTVPTFADHPKPKEAYESWEGDKVEVVIVSYFEPTNEYVVTYKDQKTKSVFTERLKYFRGTETVNGAEVPRWAKAK